MNIDVWKISRRDGEETQCEISSRTYADNFDRNKINGEILAQVESAGANLQG